MLLQEYKKIYADTNVVSDICKPNGLLNNFMERFSVSENLFCFSTYTLYEISKNDELMKQFQKFYSVFPCAIIASYFPLGMKEYEFIRNEAIEIEPIIVIPQGIQIDGKGMSPKSLEVLISQENVQSAIRNVENYTTKFFEEIKSIFNSEEFKGVTIDTCSRNQFIDRFKKYELRYRFASGQKLEGDIDKTKINKMKSLEVLAQGIYYKFYSDSKRKVNKSDIIDVLIMTTAPYVDTFISEGNCIDIYKKIIKMNKCGITNNYMTISELKK